MIQLKPSNAGILGTITQIEVTVLPFQTNATSCSIYYKLSDAEGKELGSGNIALTEEQFLGWGGDNTYVSDIVINQLGLEKSDIVIEDSECEEPLEL